MLAISGTDRIIPTPTSSNNNKTQKIKMVVGLWKIMKAWVLIEFFFAVVVVVVGLEDWVGIRSSIPTNQTEAVFYLTIVTADVVVCCRQSTVVSKYIPFIHLSIYLSFRPLLPLKMRCGIATRNWFAHIYLSLVFIAYLIWNILSPRIEMDGKKSVNV